MPYLYRNAIETSRTGVPVMRSMVLEFTEDRNCDYLADQYMFGDSLLVAPIFNDQSMAEYYLPEGTWTSLLDDSVKEGGRWYKEKHGYLSVPLYVRENSIVALGSKDQGPVYDYADQVTYQVYQVKDGGVASTVVYSTENEIESEIQVCRRGNIYQVIVTSEKASKVVLKHIGTPVSVEDVQYSVSGSDVEITLNGNAAFTVVAGK
jgi:alpha-D-xyloside xylohydrolase